MPKLVYVSPTNFATKYITGLVNDPNVPAGFILTGGSDGATDRDQMTFQAGINSGGFPSYTNDPQQAASQPKWINGIFGTKGGNAV